jgi:predicted pyridoxine 5'-phosphate oxidase superfamily flavin-nucleotide-binding protein
MLGTYHEGEIAVQERAGVHQMSKRVGNIIRSEIPPVAQDFLAEQQMLVASSVDAEGHAWASLLTGRPGFIQVRDATTVEIQIQAGSTRLDPIFENLQRNPAIGIVAIELASRRRMRLNGQAQILANGNILVHSQQSYSNCPKYIQARTLEVTAELPTPNPQVTQGSHLTTELQTWLEKADTFFVGSYHPVSGLADASHRGGQPGFIKVQDSKTLVWPDYAGNMMFNTLGNIAANPNTGLLFIDFEQVATLQLTGQAYIKWDSELQKTLPGAQRLIEFQIEQAIVIKGGQPLNWQFLNYSPFNPH